MNPAPEILRNLFDKASRDKIEWSAYSEQGRVGARIHRIYQSEDGTGPLSAIVQFLPGARAARHIHPGNESILVLEGSYTDEFGHYTVGDLTIYPPGNEHAWWSDEGAIMYVVWDKPTVLAPGP